MGVFTMNYYCNFVRLGQRSAFLHRLQFPDQDNFCKGIAIIVHFRSYQVKGAYNQSEGSLQGWSYLFSRAYNGQ